jgi:hypothetical protein
VPSPPADARVKRRFSRASSAFLPTNPAVM